MVDKDLSVALALTRNWNAVEFLSEPGLMRIEMTVNLPEN
jgi:hypothetical protein